MRQSVQYTAILIFERNMGVDEHFSHFFPPLAYQRQGQPSGGVEVLQLLVGGRGKKRKDDAEYFNG